MKSLLAGALDGVDGFLRDDEAQLLYDLAQSVPAGQTIVEIGSYRGRSTIALALGAPEGVLVYAIDPHDAHEAGGHRFDMADNAIFMANVVRAGVGHKIRVVNLPSSLGAHRWEGWRNVGLLWIDGAHDYEAVKQDVDLWSWYLVPGGKLVLHDSTGAWEGPTRAANELKFNDGWTEYLGVGYTRVFRKETP